MIFIAAVVAFTLVIQGTYKKAPLFAKYPVVDEILGGLLGVVQGFLLLLFVVIILDQYYLYTNIPPAERRDRVPAHVLGRPEHAPTPGNLLHGTVIPAFITIFGLPDPGRGALGLRRGMTAGRGAGGLLPAHRTPPSARTARTPFPRDLLAGDTLDAARALIGARLVRDGGRSGRATEPAGRAGSSRSRRTSARAISRRTPAWARPPGTPSCTGRPGSPTSILSTACTTA